MDKSYEKLVNFTRRALNFDTESEVYIRLRSGPNRRQAKKIASGIDLDGQDCANLSRDLMTRCKSVEGDPVWVELLESGGTEILDSVYLPNPLEVDVSEFENAGSIANLAKVCADMARSADMRADLAQDRLLQMMRISMEFHRTAVEAESNLMIEQSEKTGDMDRALEMMAPLLPIVAAKLAGAPIPQLSDDNGHTELTDEQLADHLVGSIMNLGLRSPEVITQERLSVLSELIRK